MFAGAAPRGIPYVYHIGHVTTHGKEAKFSFLIEISEGSRLIGRPRRRWEDNIKIGLKEMRSEDVGWLWPGISDELW